MSEAVDFTRGADISRLPPGDLSAPLRKPGRKATETPPASGAREVLPLDLLDPRTWTMDPPPRRWVVTDWVQRGTVTGLYGDGGIGKSLFVQQLLTASALALPCLGLDVAGGRALGVFCEDHEDELHRRQHDINRMLGVPMECLENLRLLSRLGEDNTLFTYEGGCGANTALYERLEATCAAFRPKLLVLDTAADLFGGNENERAAVRAFIATCLGRLARDHDAAVILCAHPSAAGLGNGTGAGGSTAWNNTFRSRLYLTRPKADGEAVMPDDGRRVLTRMKSNYSATGAQVEMVWQRGAFVEPSATARGADAATWPVVSAMFDELERAWKAGRAWSYRKETRKAGRYFPAWAKTHLGVPEDRVVKLLAEWQMNDCLSYEEYNKRTKARGLRVLRRPDQ